MLNKFNPVPFRIFHYEATAPVFQRANRTRHLNALGCHVSLQGRTIFGRECEVVHTVGSLRIRSRTISHPLRADHETLCLSRLDRVGGRETELSDVEMTIRVGRCGIEIHVIDAGDLGTLWRGVLLRSCGGGENENPAKNSAHGISREDYVLKHAIVAERRHVIAVECRTAESLQIPSGIS